MKKSCFLLVLLLLCITACVDYEIEKEGVYYKDWNEARGTARRLLEGADQKSFEVLKDRAYGKDKQRVYYQGRLIEGADPQSFRLLGDLYALDKRQAYYAGAPIETSSSRGFRIIDSYYSADSRNVYYTTHPLNVCSVADFRFIEDDGSESSFDRWSTDGCYYYNKQFKIPSDDYPNVKIYKGSAGIARDTKYVYYLDRNIYYNMEGKRVLDTLDIATFQVTGYLDCHDKWGCINVFHGREECDSLRPLPDKAATY